MEIAILGSCVTRDAFNYTNTFEVSSFIARTCINSIVSNSLDIDIDVLGLISKFQARNVYYDLNKVVKSNTDILDGEYLIMDFIDERFQQLKVGNSIITYSSELNKSKFLENNVYETVEFDINMWHRDLILFRDIILKRFSSDKIILHKIFLCDKYIDKNREVVKFNNDKLAYIDKFNKKLERMYEVFLEVFENVKVIYLENDYLANENHRWGLAPFHYDKNYNMDFLEKLYKMISLEQGESISKLNIFKSDIDRNIIW